MDWIFILGSLGMFSSFPPFLISIFIKTENIPVKILKYYTYLCFVFSVLTYVLNILGINNLLLMNVYNVIELIFLTLFYIQIIDIKTSKLFYFVYSLLIIGFTIFMFSMNSLVIMDFQAWSVSNIIIVIFALLYFLRVMIYNLPNQFKTEFIIISISVIIYFVGTIFLFLLIPLIGYNDNTILSSLWQINNVLGIISNVLITYSLWKIKSKTQLYLQ